MLTFTEKDASIDLPYVLEQARVRGAVRVRREDGQAFVILPAAAGGLADRVADEQETWLNALAPVAVVRDDLPCSECGYNLRNLPAAGRCPECGRPVEQTFETMSAANPGLRFNLRRAQVEELAGSQACPADALLFVIDAIVTECRHKLRSLPNGPVSCTPPEVCAAVRDYARRYFNDEAEARELLAEWKLCRGEDVGAAVRLLVGAGMLQVCGCEGQAAFDNLFTLATLFRQ